jgi:16S rRNA processing protein RimM
MGKVTRGHGLRGELKVMPITDDPQRLCELETVYLGSDTSDVRAYRVLGGRIQTSTHGAIVLLQLQDVSDRTAADALQKRLVYALEDDVPLDEDEVFLHDLIGLHVESVAGEVIGRIKDVVSMPAQDLFIVERPNQPDAWIPAVPAFIKDIDLNAGLVRITPIDGLLD